MFFKNSQALFNPSKFLLILLFTYAGISKLMGHDQFEAQLNQISLLQNFAGFISVFLPILELLIALFLIFDRTLIMGLILSGLLMTAFTIYVGGMLLFRSTLTCSCDGIISSMTWKEHLYFNLFFMFLSWNTLISYYKNSTQLNSLVLIQGSKLKTFNRVSTFLIHLNNALEHSTFINFLTLKFLLLFES